MEIVARVGHTRIILVGGVSDAAVCAVSVAGFASHVVEHDVNKNPVGKLTLARKYWSCNQIAPYSHCITSFGHV